MTSIQETVAAISTTGWNQRPNLVRQIPEHYGRASQAGVYSLLAREVYVPELSPDFAFVVPRDEYGLGPVSAAYRMALTLTDGFTRVTTSDIAAAIRAEPTTVGTWRLILGYIWREMAEATAVVGAEFGMEKVSADRLKKLEQGVAKKSVGGLEAEVIAEVVVRGVQGTLWPSPEDGRRTKQDRPDLQSGWSSLREFAVTGVPLELLLHQRHYGGAFRQLLDASGKQRGDVLEQELEDVIVDQGVPYLRTGAHNQKEISNRFSLTVKPAPDFVFYDTSGTLRAILEVKLTNDGGTARDKASRFATLRTEASRLGGVPLFALLDGLGWARVGDALGPVVQACDGRVFTRSTLLELLEVDPFPQLIGLNGGGGLQAR